MNKFAKGLLWVALGLLFVLLDTDFKPIQNNYLPDFLGYLFLVHGLKYIQAYHMYFKKCRKASRVMVVISLIYGPVYIVLLPKVYYFFSGSAMVSMEQLTILINAGLIISVLTVIIKSTAGIIVVFYLIQAVKAVFNRVCKNIISVGRFGMWFFCLSSVFKLICLLLMTIPIMVKSEKIFFTLASFNVYGHGFYFLATLTILGIMIWASKLALIYREQLETPAQ